VLCQLVPAAGLGARSCPWARRFDSSFLFRPASRPVLSASPRNPSGLAAARLPSSNALILDSCIEDSHLVGHSHVGHTPGAAVDDPVCHASCGLLR
jgi:hypothetical protein